MRLGTLAAILLCSPVAIHAQGFGSLKKVGARDVPGIERYVRDPKALVALGKALFWDMQVGADGLTACATCHFHAGADHRLQNMLAGGDPAHRLTAEEFPFRVFADRDDRRSAVLRDSSLRAGSAWVTQPGPGDARLTTRRNTPTVINSVFHPRTFLDGRASDIFTGLTPF